MEFVRLGEAYSTQYLPDKLIEGYNSLIWTERFQEFGEFEVKSFAVDRMQDLLPEDTLVSHLETEEVMMVETHTIEDVGEGADAIPEITIRGRSALKILEERWVDSNYQKKRQMRKDYTAAAAIGVLIVNAVDNASGADLTRGEGLSFADDTVIDHYPWNTLDVIPNVAVSEAVLDEGNLRSWILSQGTLWPQIQNILVSRDLGLRMVRPTFPNQANIITVRSAIEYRGDVVRTVTNNAPQLRFEVYSGIDRTTGDAAVNLSMLHGHLEKPQYLDSAVELRTASEIMAGDVTNPGVVYSSGANALTGWRRRVTGFDAGAPEIPPAPEKPADIKKSATKAQKQKYDRDLEKWEENHGKWKNKRSNIINKFEAAAREDAARELKKKRRIKMFSGEVSTRSPYQYRVNYNLGDAVMLFGDYGKKQKMVVYEYVRTEDINGDRGIPGLVLP